ncbi:MAG TPA: hypothetical protein PLP27_09115 [Crocinitomicaceae bacterium]|nr:hypothetical protein [Crocinitomicaceae bacterium]
MKTIFTALFVSFSFLAFSQTIEIDKETNVVTVDGTPVFILEVGLVKDKQSLRGAETQTLKNLNGDTLIVFKERKYVGIGAPQLTAHTKTQTNSYTTYNPRGTYGGSYGSGIQTHTTKTHTTTFNTTQSISEIVKYDEITFVDKNLGTCELRHQWRGKLLVKYIYDMKFIKDNELNEGVVKEFITKTGTQFTDLSKDEKFRKTSDANYEKLKIELQPTDEE